MKKLITLVITGLVTLAGITALEAADSIKIDLKQELHIIGLKTPQMQGLFDSGLVTTWSAQAASCVAHDTSKNQTSTSKPREMLWDGSRLVLKDWTPHYKGNETVEFFTITPEVVKWADKNGVPLVRVALRPEAFAAVIPYVKTDRKLAAR